MNIESQSSFQRRLLLGIFVVSGFSGLIYESIWSHYLKLFLGHAAYAQTLVLVIFMGGMALGSWLVGRYCGKLKRLLWGYILVEGVIGVLGIAFHPTFAALTELSFQAVIPALSSDALIHTYKWSLAALLILPQSTLLGMTFPLISGGIIRRWPDRPGETLSLLYFANSLGAAIGVLASGFLLIRMVGLPGTIFTAGLINIMLALLAYTAVRGQVEPVPGAGHDATRAGGVQHWFLLAAFLTGAASFLYEIGWIRMLSLVLGSSSHSFELMLSAFIFGLACGGLWMRRRIDRLVDPLRYLAVTMMVMGTLALLTLPTYNTTFDFVALAIRTFTPTESGYTAFNILSQAVAMLVMLPTTFCAGMTLPLLTHALLKRGSGEAAIGKVYAANTAGAIVGTLAAVHVLMPLVGVKGVIVSGGAVHMALGLSGLAMAQSFRPVLRAALGALCVAMIGIAIFGASLDPLRMTSSVYRTGETSQPPDSRVLYLRDGKTATVSLTERNGIVAIATNGKPDAAIRMGDGAPSSDEITMVLAAALPLSMHPHPQRVANIGFGSGLTSNTLLLSEGVRTLDSIELEPFMVEAARQGYSARIHRVFEDPRSRIFFEDAKTFFATAREPYDVIVSEPSNPWVSGVATLFSEEFYRRLTAHLSEDGYLVQWLQIYETDLSVIASIVKALGRHFGSYEIYNADDANILIVASPRAQLPAPDAAIFSNPLMRAELARVGISSIADIRQRRIGDQRTLGPLLAAYPVPTNSDFFPFVDLNASRLRFMRRSAIELPSLLVAPVPVVDLLDPQAHTPGPTQPPHNSLLFRDRLTRSALAVRDAVLNRRVDALDPAVAIQAMVLWSSAEQCRDAGIRRAWLGAVRSISDLTTPYLMPADLRPMWTEILAGACYRETSGSQRLWADLTAAVSTRDGASIAQTGAMLLGGQMSATERSYLVTALSAAQIRLGRVHEARQLLETTWDSLDHSQVYALPLAQLMAIAQSAASAPGPAGAAPL
jgi:spermidine synthase